MNYLQLIYPVLDALSEGRIIRKIVSIYLKVQAALLALVCVGAVVMILKFSFADYVPVEGTIAGMLVTIIVTITFFFIIQIHLYRASKIDEMEDSTYTIIPIISNNFRLAGEVYAVLIVAFSFSGFLAIALTGSNFLGNVIDIGDYIPFMDMFLGRGESTFLSGLMLLLSGFIAAFFAIILAYFFAEIIIVFVDMAHSIRKLGINGAFESNQRNSLSYSTRPVVKEDDI